MRERLFHAASQFLLVALIATFGFAVLSFTPQGKAAAELFGGLGKTGAPIALIKLAYLLDLVFPVFYGAGLAGIAAAFSGGGNRPFAKIIVFATLIAASCDLVENHYIYLEAANGAARPQFIGIMTILKYGLLAIASVGISALLPRRNGYYQFMAVVLRFIVPVSTAFMLSESGGDLIQYAFGIGFMIALAGLAWVAWHEATLLQASSNEGISPDRDGGRVSKTPQVPMVQNQQETNADGKEAPEHVNKAPLKPVVVSKVADEVAQTDGKTDPVKKTKKPKKSKKKRN